MTADLVEIVHDRAITTSLKVAKVFEKNHRDVLKDIRTLISDLEGVRKNSQTPYFRETTYIHLQNGQEYPMFEMDFDAFTLLAMGFTGRKALQFKLAYINAFNAMNKRLTELEIQRQNEEWQAARKMTKIEFRRLTDTIRDVLIPLMEKEGASEAAKRWVYKNYVSMIQKLLNIPTGGRDEMPLALQYELSKAEDMARVIIRGRVASNTASQQIYSDTKSTIGNYVQISLFNQRFLEV